MFQLLLVLTLVFHRRNEMKEYEMRHKPPIQPDIRYYGDSRAELVRKYKQKRESVVQGRNNAVASGKQPVIPNTDFETNKEIFSTLTDDGRFTFLYAPIPATL